MITEMDSSFSSQTEPSVNKSHFRSNSLLSPSFDIKLYRNKNNTNKKIDLKRSISTFDSFMKSNKIKKKISNLNTDYFNNSKTFTSFNSSASSSNNILKNTNFKKEISVISPTLSSSKRKHFYLSDIMQTKYKFGALNTLVKDKKAMPLSRKELIKKKDLENYNSFISGFKLN